MKKHVGIIIPDDLDFADLRLARVVETGGVEFDWSPIERICTASAIDVAVFRYGSEDNVAELITSWYREHLARGGAHDAVADDLIAEAAAEDALGDGLSHPPGRA